MRIISHLKRNGNLYFGLLAFLGLTSAIGSTSLRDRERDQLRAAVYRTADIDHSGLLEDGELVGLAKELGTIGDGKVVPMSDLASKVGDSSSAQFREYLRKHDPAYKPE